MVALGILLVGCVSTGRGLPVGLHTLGDIDVLVMTTPQAVREECRWPTARSCYMPIASDLRFPPGVAHMYPPGPRAKIVILKGDEEALLHELQHHREGAWHRW